MAFPDSYTAHENKEQVKQLSNAVTPPAATKLLKRCIDTLGE